MKRVPIIFLFCLISSQAAAGDGYAIGPIKAGMTYEELRAATPGADWKPLPFRGLSSDKAFVLGGLSFGAQYIPEPWDRYRILAFHAEPLSDVTSCHAAYESVAKDIQSSVGEWTAPPAFAPSEIGYEAEQSQIALGQGSALLIERVDRTKPKNQWFFELSAVFHRGATTVNMDGEAKPPVGEKPAQCIVRVTLGEYNKRPKKGFVPASDLVFTAQPSISRLHHSLDGMTPPSEPLAVTLNCDIDDTDGELENCTLADGAGPEAAYLPVALARAKDYRVADKSRSGKWTPGESTALSIRISASDRYEGLRIGTSKQSLLKFVAYPRREEMVRYYPREALAAGAKTQVEVGCVVMADLSAVCPEISVPPGPFQAQFSEAVSDMVTIYRVAPVLSDGTSAVGTGFRARLNIAP